MQKRTPNYTVRGSVVNIVKCRVYKAFLFNLQWSHWINNLRFSWFTTRICRKRRV